MEGRDRGGVLGRKNWRDRDVQQNFSGKLMGPAFDGLVNIPVSSDIFLDP